jgi:hypothetical protein
MKNPLRYQITEYDCGPTSLLNALSFLFEREELAPEIIKNIMLFSLDAYGSDGFSGKNGTTQAAMMFLSQWLNGFGKTGRLDIRSSFLSQREVNLRDNSRIRDALVRKGAAVVRLDLESWHYVLLTGIDGDNVYLFDPYYMPEDCPLSDVRSVLDHEYDYNRIVPVSRIDCEEIHPYAFGPYETREAVLIFNGQTMLTEEDTVEYVI